MSEFKKLQDIAPKGEKRNNLLNEILSNASLLKELNDLGIKEEEIPFYIPLLITYLDAKKICANCRGLDKCESESLHLRPELSIGSSGRLISSLGPCPLYAKQLKIDTNFLYRDFDSSWNGLNIGITKKNKRLNEVGKELAKASKGKDGCWCYLYGSSGTGKSYLLAAFANFFAELGKSVCFIDTLKRFDELKGYSIKNKPMFVEMMGKLEKCDLLVLDGFGNEYKSDYVRDQILLPLLNARSKNKLATFFSSEFSLNEIETLYSTSKSGAILAHRLVELIERNINKETILECGIDSYF